VHAKPPAGKAATAKAPPKVFSSPQKVDPDKYTR
jgi:hypothetical protein